MCLHSLGIQITTTLEYQEIPQSQLADKPMTPRGSHTTITRHQEDKLSKTTSTLFPIKIIAKLTLSNAQQNKEQLQNPTIGVTLNSKSTTAALFYLKQLLN